MTISIHQFINQYSIATDPGVGVCLVDAHFAFLSYEQLGTNAEDCNKTNTCIRRVFWWKLFKTKVAGHPQFSGGWLPFRTPNPEGPRPHVLEPWSLIVKASF